MSDRRHLDAFDWVLIILFVCYAFEHWVVPALIKLSERGVF